MQDADRLWKDLMRLAPSVSPLAVLEWISQCLDVDAPWTTRLIGVLGAVFQYLGPQVGASVYAPVKPAGTLYTMVAAGLPGPMAVPWGQPVAGLAASELSGQFAGDSRAFPDYQGGWLGVKSALAVPLIRDARLYAVVEVRGHGETRLGMVEAEWIGQVAELLAQRWPMTVANKTQED